MNDPSAVVADSGVPRASAIARAVAPVFHHMLDGIDRALDMGAIDATLPDGTHRLLGGRAEGPVAVVNLRRWRALVRLATGGSVGWYEAWVAGDWSSPDAVPLFALFMANRVALGGSARSAGIAKLAARAWHRLRRNDRSGARRNIAAHYDLGNDFYAAWLDPGMTYSSAIFEDPSETLEAAQDRKLAAILSRTATRPGDTILEIGCGWGSFAERASRDGVKVHAITLSAEQRAVVEVRGLSGITVSMTDYRDVTGAYDAVASIEMVEAVGEAYWPAYLDAVARALKPGGRAAIQYIAIADDVFPAYARGVDFIQRYVFPGGMLLSESRFRALAEARGLDWKDIHHFGSDYADTLLRWRTAFEAARSEGRLPVRFDARFVALWRYYLMYCEGGFRGGGIDVAQVTLIKS
ncbi:class I SAM-dependent methyltransferase [Sphingomonas sp.]|jgi:cyclopropane-fatty-acyl-phospholipid synthase|uniref:class I SAM-dependent methyltransferase n=1 Tax=Sphingomonas sp. TaxID=28214 RepID=UPI0039C8CBC0